MEYPEFNGQVAVVTGAAGGIGGAVARALGGCGAVVAAVDRDAERLHTTVEKMRSDDRHATGYPGDVTNAVEIEALVDRVERELGPIDYLVNTAGVLRVGHAVSLTDEQWSETFAVNATSVFVVSRAVVNRMIPRGRGAVVTVASNVVGTARVGMGAYAASKAAASTFTKCLGLEVARYGIRCNLVAPGSTDTPMLRALWQDGDAMRSSIEGRPDAYRVGIPLGKVGLPTEVADAVLFLLSDHATHVTMHQLTVDGGATLGV